MENELTKIFSNLSDAQIREAVIEMKEDEESGIIRSEGWVSRLTKQVHEITDQPVSTLLFLTQTNLFREAAFRFVK